MSLILNSGVRIGPGVVLDANPYNPITAVTAGLRLHLDAGNPTSYPGSGTTWTDLVDEKEFTLYNSPLYNSNNGGYINFIPSSSQWASATSFPDSLSNWTLEAWHYYAGTNSEGSPCIITEAYNSSPINFALGNCSDSSPNLQVGHWDGSNWNPTPQGTVLTTGQWYHVVGTFDGTAHKLYVNGTLAQTQETTSPANRSGVGIYLMSRWDYAQYWGGGLAVVRIYDTALDLAGVTQNYTAERARFGL